MNCKEDVTEELENHSGEKFEIEIEHERNYNGIGEKADVAYRHRLFHTVCICISIFALGWRNALIGPTLPDLRLIINEDLSKASFIFTAKSLGGLIGAVCGGFAYDRYNKIAVFVSTVLAMGVVAAVTPWCSCFAAMLIVHVFHGVSAAAVETAATADMAVIWKQNAGPFMQAIQFAFSAGAIVSPLIAGPFLAATINIDSQLASEFSNSSKAVASVDVQNTPIANVQVSNFESELGVNMTSAENGKSRIYIPYSITALVCFVSACLYLLICFVYGNVYRIYLTESSGMKTDTTLRRYFLSKRKKVILTILLALALLFYVVSEHCFIGFLMTFVISELKWSKARGSTASSAFWIAFAIGRLSGIIIVKFVSISKTIIMFSSILISGAVLFLLAVMFGQNFLVWVSVVVIGYGMSVIFSLVFTWLSQNIRTLTGKITSIFFVFNCTGTMVMPILVGYLMDKISQMWFAYSLLVMSIAMFLTFMFALVLFNMLKNVHYESDKTKNFLKVQETE